MYDISWAIKIKTEGIAYRLTMVAEIEINSSVDSLADTAVITLPEAVMNQVLNLDEKIKRGSEVWIQAGYDEVLNIEFVGYVQDITTNNSSLKIICEDALFLFRRTVKDAQIKATSLKQIAQTIVSQIDPSYSVVCDFEIVYEKFVIHQATAYDVLKKLAEETKANIYFNTATKQLHLHAPYAEKGGNVVYSMQKNIEKSSLEFKKAVDRKVEVTVERTDVKGKVEKYTTGTTGGDSVTIKAGAISKESMEKLAKAALIRRSADMYEGSIDTWLVPFCQPSFSAKIMDEDYPDKDGNYYVVATTTTINESGAKRAVKLGIKLSV